MSFFFPVSENAMDIVVLVVVMVVAAVLLGVCIGRWGQKNYISRDHAEKLVEAAVQEVYAENSRPDNPVDSVVCDEVGKVLRYTREKIRTYNGTLPEKKLAKPAS